MKSLLYCRDPGKAGQNFIPAKRDHVITPLEERRVSGAIRCKKCAQIFVSSVNKNLICYTICGTTKAMRYNVNMLLIKDLLKYIVDRY